MEAIKTNLLSHQIGTLIKGPGAGGGFINPARGWLLPRQCDLMISRRSLSKSSSSSIERRSAGHLPGCARHLDLLGFGQVTALDQGALHAVAALPGAGDVGVIGKRDLGLPRRSRCNI